MNGDGTNEAAPTPPASVDAGVFSLESSPANASIWTTGAAASAFGVTDQTIRNWIEREGMPAERLPVDSRGRRCFRLDQAAVRAWVTVHKSHVLETGSGGIGGGGGGRRAGAGRKSKASIEAAATLPLPEPTPEEIEAGKREEELSRKAAALLTEEGLKAALGTGQSSEGGLTNAEAVRRYNIIKAALAQQELEQARGNLVSAGDVRRAWTILLATMRHQLGNLGARVSTETGLAPEAAASVRLNIDSHIRRLLSELERAPFTGSTSAEPFKKAG